MTDYGFFAEIADYKVLALGSTLTIYHPERSPLEHTVDGLGDFVSRRIGSLTMGWARLPDFEILYLFDKRDGFGYAVNVDAPELSEWGYAPFTPDRSR